IAETASMDSPVHVYILLVVCPVAVSLPLAVYTD
ncbi:hypothetical protein EVA_14459, partial [gut metagenome]